MNDAPPRFGIWALVHGSRAARQDPEEPFDASWARNRALVLHPVLAAPGAADRRAREAVYDGSDGRFTLPPRTAVVFVVN